MRFTISVKVVLSITILFVFAFIMGGYSAYSTSLAASDSEDVEKYYVQAREYSSDISDYMLVLMRYVPLYLVVPREAGYSQITEMAAKVRNTMSEFSGFMEQPRSKEIMGDVSKSTKELATQIDSYINISMLNIEGIRGNQKTEQEFLKNVNDFSAIIADVVAFSNSTIVKGIEERSENVDDVFDNLRRMNMIAVEVLRISELYRIATATNTIDGFINAEAYITRVRVALDDFKKNANFPRTVAAGEELDKLLKVIESDFLKTKLVYADIIKTDEKRSEAATVLQKLNADIGIMTSASIRNRAGGVVESLQATNTVIISLLGVMFLVGVGVIIMLQMSVIKPIQRFVEVVGELTSGDGDLTKRIATSGNDELADLAQRFNTFIKNVQEIVSEVKRSADEVASGNNQLASTMEELSTTFSSQTEQVSGIVNDMDNIKDASKTSVDDLSESLRIMNTTSEETDKGASKLGDVRVSITHIHDKTESLSGTIGQLSESSSQIGEILTVINDIADQTNLLALNAAIEAARAGDAGRGFAVVADEVRKLAERTQKATSEIESIIGSLQRQSELASKEMLEAGNAVKKGVEVIDETARSFEVVVSGVYKIKDGTNVVVKSVSSQYDTIQAVGDKTQIIASGVEESNAAVAEVAATVTHLQEMAEKLKGLVGRFKS